MNTANIYFRAWVDNAVGAHADISRADLPLAPQPHHDGEQLRPAYVCGIYFLFLGSDLQYVGKSKNIYARIAQHMAQALFAFDSFRIDTCLSHQLDSLEAKAIHATNPRWNRTIPAYQGKRHLVKRDRVLGPTRTDKT